MIKIKAAGFFTVKAEKWSVTIKSHGHCGQAHLHWVVIPLLWTISCSPCNWKASFPFPPNTPAITILLCLRTWLYRTARTVSQRNMVSKKSKKEKKILCQMTYIVRMTHWPFTIGFFHFIKYPTEIKKYTHKGIFTQLFMTTYSQKPTMRNNWNVISWIRHMCMKKQDKQKLTAGPGMILKLCWVRQHIERATYYGSFKQITQTRRILFGKKRRKAAWDWGEKQKQKVKKAGGR